jgi:hypothetical protein
VLEHQAYAANLHEAGVPVAALRYKGIHPWDSNFFGSSVIALDGRAYVIASTLANYLPS